jgi:hypothetical protein
MDDLLARFVSDLVGRLHGPFSFRFLMQPTMALIYAAHDGLADARVGRPPYFWTIFTQPGERWRLLREGWRAVTRVLVLGAVMDAIYQLIVFRWIHPLQLVVVVPGLAFVPYVLCRGPVERIATWWATRRRAKPGPPGKEPNHVHGRTDRTGRGRYA